MERYSFVPYHELDAARAWLESNRFLAKVEERSLEVGLAQRLQSQRAGMLSHMDMIYRDAALIGVIVLTPRTTCMFVDALYVPPHQLTEEAQIALDQHCRERAATYRLKRLRMHSSRRAINTIAGRFGWKLVSAEYEKVIEE